MSALKRCSKCKKDRPLTDFYVLTKRHPDGSLHYRACKYCQGERAHHSSRARRARTALVDLEKVAPLPIKPWRDWLLEQLPKYGGKKPLAEALGVHESLVRRWLNGERLDVRLDTADRVLCKIRKPWLLRELWPELYAFPQESLENRDDIA